MPLVGREAERALIEGLLSEARGGTSGVLRISGDAGVGKTALCDFAVRHAGEMRILRTFGVETEAELAFAGLGDLLGPLLERLDSIPEPQAAALAGALAIGPPVAGDRFTICAATLSLIATAAEEQPLLVIVDDAQWVDAPSAEALLFAARRLEGEAIAILIASRTGGSGLFERAALPELALEGLGFEAASELLGETPVSLAAAERLYDETGGNPLALLELAALDREAGAVDDALSTTEIPLTQTIELALARRTRLLPDAAQRTLLVAAASDSGDVATIMRASAAVAGDEHALALAEAAGLVKLEGGRIDFKHPLLRSAIYEQAPAALRQEAHQALAAAEDGTLGGERRAWHLAAAATKPDSAVASALEDAAESAKRRGGHASAATAFERSAQLTQGSEERARRLLAGADEARRGGETERAMQLLEEALPLTADPRLRAGVQHLHGVLETWRGSPMTAHALLFGEATRVESVDPGKAALMFADAAWASLMAGEIATGLETAERACEVARRKGGVEEVLAGVVLAEARVLRGDAGGAAQLAVDLQVFEDDDLLSRSPELVQTAGQIFTWIEEYEAARRLLTRAIDKARERSSLGTLPYALASLSELDFRTGNWAAAYTGATEALRLATETSQVSGRAYSLVCLARIEAAQGRESGCRDHATEAFELAAFGVRSIVVYAASALGLLELGCGRPGVAIEHLERVAHTVPRHGIGEPAVVQWAPDLIEAYIRSGRATEAERALADFVLQAEATQRTWALAAAARCRGLATEGDYESEFGLALELLERLPAPFERARTLLCLGERRRRVRRRVDARAALYSALDVFERLGAAPWAERARRELEASGETIRRTAPSSDELTAQELQVALLVAGGATNREAGAALFLSAKTIETHLGRVYRKLSVRSRTELAARFASGGPFLADHGVRPS
jgi:DNA-binding CsgD family transcriptional regulator/tetratricopeptide (TPR) repeat protein